MTRGLISGGGGGGEGEERRGLNNKSECCQYTSYNKLCYTHTTTTTRRPVIAKGREGWGGGGEKGYNWDWDRRECLGKIDYHSNYLTCCWHHLICGQTFLSGGGSSGSAQYLTLSISEDVKHFLSPAPQPPTCPVSVMGYLMRLTHGKLAKTGSPTNGFLSLFEPHSSS